jgi:hypothetical protein
VLIGQAFVFMAGERSLNRQDRARQRQMAGHWQMATPRLTKITSSGDTGGAPWARR